MADEKVVVKSVKVEYLSTKQDKYDNEMSYFKIKDKNIDQKFGTIIKEGYNLPWFKSENGQTILKVKSKYVKLKECWIRQSSQFSNVSIISVFEKIADVPKSKLQIPTEEKE